MREFTFISVEGIDGAGKSTVVSHLGDQYWNAVITRQPVSVSMRNMMMHEGVTPEGEALLAAASLQFAVDTVIAPAKRYGRMVISDRFHDSLIAYQGYGHGLDIDWLEGLMPSVIPDFTILLDCDLDTAWKRLKHRGVLDRIESRPKDFWERVRAGYLDIAEYQYDRVVLIDANRPLEDVLRDVDEKLQELRVDA